MDISQNLFTFPFQDEDWVKKALTGGAIALAAYGCIFAGAYLWWLILPICLYFVGVALSIPLGGYGVRSMRHVIETGEPALPEWGDAGGMFHDGLLMFVPGFVYSLPLLILYGCGFLMMLAGSVGPTLASVDPDYLTPGIIATAVGLSGWMVTISCGFVLAIPLGLWSYVAATRAVALDRISAAFEIEEVWALLKAGLGPYLLSIGMLYGIGMLGMIAVQFLTYTIVLCCVVPFLYCGFMWYLLTVGGALGGMAYRAAHEKLDAAEISDSN
jgi:hypothetical protein